MSGSPGGGGSERLVVAAFAGNALFAGGGAVGVRLSNRELDPLWGASVRFGLAAILMLLLMAGLRLRVPRGRALTGALLYGALNFGAAFALFYYALVELQAGFGQILLALMPLATLLLAVAQRQERLHASAFAGIVLAVVGVAVMSRAPLRESIPPLSLLAALGSVLCFAQAAVIVRRFPDVHPVAMNAVGMTTGATLLVAGAVLAGDPIVLPESAATWAGIAYVVVVGSVVVFLLYLYVLRHWVASRTAYVFVLVPFVTVALSAWIDDEPVGAGLVFGGALVLAGVYVGALRPGAWPPNRGSPRFYASEGPLRAAS